jgi:co-chaperonin GroES (HSP10)
VLRLDGQEDWTGATPKHPVKEVWAGDRIRFGTYFGNEVSIENDTDRTTYCPDGGAR